MRRSGNHAIIQWILAQSEGVTEFFNDASPEAPYAKTPVYGNWESPKSPSHITLSVVSYEDRSFEILRACEKKFVQQRTPAQKIELLIVRDPFNMFASRLHSPYIKAWRPAYICGLTAPQLAEDYIEAYLCQHFPKDPLKRLITANFNQWMTDSSYRKCLADSLNLPFSDKGMEKLSHYGGGSSFDGKSGQPNRMVFDERWRQYMDNRTFVSQLRRKTFLTFTKKAFPKINTAIQTIFPSSDLPPDEPIELNRILLTPLITWLRTQALVVRLYRFFQFKSRHPKTIVIDSAPLA